MRNINEIQSKFPLVAENFGRELCIIAPGYYGDWLANYQIHIDTPIDVAEESVSWGAKVVYLYGSNKICLLRSSGKWSEEAYNRQTSKNDMALFDVKDTAYGKAVEKGFEIMEKLIKENGIAFFTN